MAVILLTRLLLMIYSIGLILGFIRILSLIQVHETRGWSDVVNLLLWPTLMMTQQGRSKLRTLLSEEDHHG
jgi:hypothetical protein